MASSEPTHVALIAGGGQALGTANPDPEVRYAIADTASAAMRNHERKRPTKSETQV